jgi:hypothetical protein
MGNIQFNGTPEEWDALIKKNKEQKEPCLFCEGTGQVVSSTTISGFKTCDCIIIPQEEPKQEHRKICNCKRAYTNPLSGICSFCWNEKFPNEKDEIKEEDLLEPKQETLEEAAANLADPNICKTDNWIAGAKYQAERMYSEEDMIEFAVWNIIQFEMGTTEDKTNEELLKDWVKQFKKK